MHIGNRIREVLRLKHTNVTWFASEICCTRTHVYKILNNPSIDTGLLVKISRVLQHDFFVDISADLQPDIHTPADLPHDGA